MRRARSTLARGALLCLAALALAAFAASGAPAKGGHDGHGSGGDNGHHWDNGRLHRFKHIVVVYEENHSFDNLYGGWEGVNGLQHADAAHTLQVDQSAGRVPYQCLLQDDINLQAPAALPVTCQNTTPPPTFPSHFTNAPFRIDDYLKPTDTTCPPNAVVAFSQANGWKEGTGSPGGCTRDIVHRFYQEIFQLDGGRQDRYMIGSDAAGLVMGRYDTRALPVYQYLHQKDHPDYAVLDNFFAAAFGGSFLNHQWLVAAATPVCDAAHDCPAGAAHSVLDRNGFPQATYPPPSNIAGLSSGPLYVSPDSGLVDAVLTQACNLPTTRPGLPCGDYGVNTMQPPYRPSGAFGAVLGPQTNPTIGDRLNAAHGGRGVDWAWYAGGWSNAAGRVGEPGWTNGSAPDPNTPTGCTDPNVDPSKRAGVPVSQWPYCPNNLFQYHHQPFNYFKAFDPNTPAGAANREAHLRDEQEFIRLAQASDKKCMLRPVSFVKPIGQENEHPGYASESIGSDHLVSLLQDIENSRCADDTLVLVTYDEFGGQWDHVPPPGQGNDNGPHDQWGPGTRIPALVISPKLHQDFVVDHTEYDTTSILATIERRWHLQPLSTRDAQVNDLSHVFEAKAPKEQRK